MKLPDTIFSRLFGLVLVAMLISHLVSLPVLFALHPPPPHPELQQPPGPPPGPPPAERGGRTSFLAVVLPIQLATGLLVAWFGARLLARPVQQLGRAAQELGSVREEPLTIPAGPAEARQAMAAFNAMKERLRRQMNERNRFLAAISHDLRTPLTRMKLRVERLPEDETRQQLQGDLADMAEMLEAALNYLRGLAKTEAPRLLDIQALVESLAENALEAGEQVTVSGEARPLPAHALLLQRGLENLLGNALRYGHSAAIRLQDSDTALHIEIRDRGPGLPDSELEAVFEPFYRLEQSRNRDSGGVGLGLSIAREAIRQHGGELTLANATDGGLIARIVLPRRLPALH